MGLGQVFAKLVLRDDTNLGEQKIQYKPKLETTEVKGTFSIDSSGIWIKLLVFLGFYCRAG